MRSKMNRITRRRAIVGLLSLVLLLVLVAAACGEDEVPTLVPSTAVPAAPAPTAVPAAPAPTAVPVAQIRTEDEWTAENPATLEEIEEALKHHRGETFTEVTWGGAWGAAVRQGLMLPFSKKFGIEIIEDSPVEYAKLRAQSQTGNVSWDVVDSGTRAVYQLGPTGDLEVLTPAIHNGYLDGFPEVARTPWSGGGGVLWSTGIAYSLKSFPNHEGAPKSWADFWDVENFPGRRSLGDRPNENLFFAQFALHPEILDSTEAKLAIARLTDAQVAESMEKLREIKPFIQVWWHSGTDCPQLLLSGELDMCSAWNGRIWDAQQGEGGDELYYCYECGHLNQTDVFYITKGSTKKHLAELYIAWGGFPTNVVEMSNYITYGPMHRDALALVESRIAPEIIDALPTSPIALEKVVVGDEEWLGTNLDALAEIFQGFLQE
ncbi:MAG: extracellular solute-binding protein [Chloroflexi bacterium]|nr:extracellular solute-binding protein [Chloroflexota bacterium]